MVGRRAGIFHHGVGNVFDETALLLERAALQNIDDDFRHRLSSLVARPPYSIVSRTLDPVWACLKFPTIGKFPGRHNRELTMKRSRCLFS